MIKKLIIGLSALALIVPSALFFGMKISPLSWGLWGPINEDGGIALQGYDPVAYFNEGAAIKGNPDKGLRHNGAIYRFSSDENKLMFKTFTEKFSPQYGGYCASAISAGFTADINPRFWTIADKKLYLFYDNGAKDSFDQQISHNIDAADNSWSNQ